MGGAHPFGRQRFGAHCCVRGGDGEPVPGEVVGGRVQEGGSKAGTTECVSVGCPCGTRVRTISHTRTHDLTHAARAHTRTHTRAAYAETAPHGRRRNYVGVVRKLTWSGVVHG